MDMDMDMDMEKLGITSNFTVSGFDEHGVGYPVVEAHFILNMDGNPIVDPVPGGSQSFNIHLADGTVLSGVEANPNNWLVGPANYTYNPGGVRQSQRPGLAITNRQTPAREMGLLLFLL